MFFLFSRLFIDNGKRFSKRFFSCIAGVTRCFFCLVDLESGDSTTAGSSRMSLPSPRIAPARSAAAAAAVCKRGKAGERTLLLKVLWKKRDEDYLGEGDGT